MYPILDEVDVHKNGFARFSDVPVTTSPRRAGPQARETRGTGTEARWTRTLGNLEEETWVLLQLTLKVGGIGRLFGLRGSIYVPSLLQESDFRYLARKSGREMEDYKKVSPHVDSGRRLGTVRDNSILSKRRESWQKTASATFGSPQFNH
jgi:hypothetical protein